MLATATAELRSNPQLLADKTVLLLDVAIGSKAEAAFIHAVIAAARSVIATIPSGDTRRSTHLGIARRRTRRTRGTVSALRASAAVSVRRRRAAGRRDWTIPWCCSPRRAKAAKRSRSRGACCRKPSAACRSIRWRCCCARRKPTSACSNTRSIAPAFPRGSIAAPGGPIRPGRALLALLACADEELSARRFAEYVSLGQVPLNEAGNADLWSPPADDIVEAVLPPDERAEDVQPEEEAAGADRARRIRSRSRRHACARRGDGRI